MKGSVLMSMVGAVVPVLADILARPSIAQTRWVRLPVRRRPQQRTANRGKGKEKTRITKPNNGGPVSPSGTTPHALGAGTLILGGGLMVRGIARGGA